jgi:hypothetical protein
MTDKAREQASPAGSGLPAAETELDRALQRAREARRQAGEKFLSWEELDELFDAMRGRTPNGRQQCPNQNP